MSSVIIKAGRHRQMFNQIFLRLWHATALQQRTQLLHSIFQ